MIPIARPDVGQEEVDAVASVLRSGLIAQGSRVAALEEQWAARVGVRHAVAVSNGTAALMSILAGLGAGPGDEVITVAHTAAATANAILSCGAVPVFVDIEPDTYLIDAKRIEAAITSRTKVVMPVHLFGLTADMDMIQAIADRHGLAVVEDACQAPGARFRGRPAGSFGHGAFSLGAASGLTTGEGGLITTNDDRLASWLRVYRNHGIGSGSAADLLGYNFRLTDLVAAVGLVQLDKLRRNISRRRRPHGSMTRHSPASPSRRRSPQSREATCFTATWFTLGAAGTSFSPSSARRVSEQRCPSPSRCTVSPTSRSEDSTRSFRSPMPSRPKPCRCRSFRASRPTPSSR
jgi:perosamine synthetase